ncbi:hypothetical protein [Sedimentisphaera salicampi]|uniref:Uncharacterized protein n=1 Tax=Sedimentisphaera salicampi TaxID=1941349 RepID=A0A1W6LN16_9BACT|nr:hypothetical protein [Sedimentisphaera salicampi]ARN57169.1 hypothetical protein STSP1_01565 [Sedimentisphaera salicampi]
MHLASWRIILCDINGLGAFLLLIMIAGLVYFFKVFSKKRKKNLEINNRASSSNKPAENELFKYPDDGENIVRINQNYNFDPNSWDICEEWATKVSGVSYRQEIVEDFIFGNYRKLEAVHQPMKNYEHAIAIYGTWKGEEGEFQRKQLGFIPDEEAQDIYSFAKKFEKFMFDAKLSMLFLPSNDTYCGLALKIALLEPKWPRFQIVGFGKKSGRKRKKVYRAKSFEDAIMMAKKDDIIVEINSSYEIKL